MLAYAKAITAALVAGLGTLATALADDGIEAQEWVWVAISFLTALGAVFAVPNRTPDDIEELADHDRRVQRADLAEQIKFHRGGVIRGPGEHEAEHSERLHRPEGGEHRRP